MKKSHVHETFRGEAERHDALDEKGKLDELPFTRLRRYAKEPSQVYALRIPVSRLAAIRWLADRRDEQPTALLREWVLERLDEELARTGPTMAKETAPEYATAAGPGRRGAARAGGAHASKGEAKNPRGKVARNKKG